MYVQLGPFSGFHIQLIINSILYTKHVIFCENGFFCKYHEKGKSYSKTFDGNQTFWAWAYPCAPFPRKIIHFEANLSMDALFGRILWTFSTISGFFRKKLIKFLVLAQLSPKVSPFFKLIKFKIFKIIRRRSVFPLRMFSKTSATKGA